MKNFKTLLLLFTVFTQFALVPLTLLAREFNATEEIKLLPSGGGAIHIEGDVNRLKVNGGVLQLSNDSGATYRDVFVEPSAANGQLIIGNGTGVEVGDLSGTANQISVGSGSGSLTLSTPQDLDTGADFQVGSLGVGAAVDADAALSVSSTTKGGRSCPVMTEAQRDAISTPAGGLCVFNSDTNKLNVYDGSNWGAVGGGIDAWVTAYPYKIGDVVHESNRIYLALTDHTSGTFATDLGNNEWVELSAQISGAGGKVAVTDASGNLVEAADLAYVDATDTLTLNGQANVDNLRIDGNTISSTSGNVTIQPAGSNPLDLTLAGISYEVKDTGTARLQIENTDVTNPDMILELFSNKSDLTDNAFFRAFGSGGPAATDADYADFGFDESDDHFVLASKVAGSGTVRPIKIETGANADQLLLATDGSVSTSGDFNITAENELRLQDAAGGEYMGFKAPNSLTASQTFTLPDGDGTANYCLSTNGSNVLQWVDCLRGGQYKNFVDLNADDENDASIFSDNFGQHATFDGGGLGSGSGTMARITAGLIDTSDAANFQYTQAAGSLNDYFYSDAFTPDEKTWAQMKFHYSYDGADGDLKTKIKCTTTSEIIYNVDLPANTAKEPYTDKVYIPSGCGDLKWGFQVAVENSGKILKWNRWNLNNNPTISKELVETAYATGADNGGGSFTDGATNIDFTEVSDSHNAFNGTIYTVQNDNSTLHVNGTMSMSTSANWYVGIFINGTIHKYYIDNAPSSSARKFTFMLTPDDIQKGDSVSIRIANGSGNLSSTTTGHWIKIVETWNTEHVITPNEASIPVKYETNASQSIPSGSETLVDFEDVINDSEGLVTTGASWKFTAKSRGMYHVSAINHYATFTATDGTILYSVVYKNGSAYEYGRRQSLTASMGAQAHSSGINTDVFLEKDDYIDVRVFQNSGSSRTLLSTATTNRISIHKSDTTPSFSAFPTPLVSSRKGVDATAIPTATNTFLDFQLSENNGNFVGCGSGNVTVSGTGCRYVAVKNGWHNINVHFIITDTDLDDNETFATMLRINDIESCHTRYVGQVSTATNLDIPINLHCRVNLSKDDELEVRVDHSAGANISLNGSDQTSWFQVEEPIGR